MHYEIEVLEDCVWQKLKDEKGKVAKFTRLKIVGERALALALPESDAGVRVLLVKTISMKDLRWHLEQTAR